MPTVASLAAEMNGLKKVVETVSATLKSELIAALSSEIGVLRSEIESLKGSVSFMNETFEAISSTNAELL